MTAFTPRIMTSRSSRPPSRDYSFGRGPSRHTAPTTDESNTSHFSLPSIESLISVAEQGTGKVAAERASIDPRLHKTGVDPQIMSERGEKAHQHSSVLHTSSPSSFGGGDGGRAPASAINDVEVHSKRQLNYPPVPHDRPVRPLQGPVSPYATSSFGSPGTGTSTTSYQGSPIEGSATPYASHQRPLPSNFPPSAAPPYDDGAGQYISHATPAWQHHHHFPHSNSSPYTPNQDRYVCPTCNKAFSRPSSLKIHTFSHTGEKPWRCQVRGCGKQFSVRSNMKRHEKGCHGGDGAYPGHPGMGTAEHAS